jgi:hypothetical protein
LHYTEYRTATGRGSDHGDWTKSTDSDVTYLITSMDEQKMVLSRKESGSWTREATGTWIKHVGVVDAGNFSEEADFTLDRSNLKVITVSDPDWREFIGLPSPYLISPTGLDLGATVVLPWRDGSGDLDDVPWTVNALEYVEVQNLNVCAWAASHTGEGGGVFPYGRAEIYAKGPETNTLLFDCAYGALLAISGSGSYNNTKADGGWQETYSIEAWVTETNLLFLAETSLQIENVESQPSETEPYYAGDVGTITFVLKNLGNVVANVSIKVVQVPEEVEILEVSPSKLLPPGLTDNWEVKVRATKGGSYEIHVSFYVNEKKVAPQVEGGETVEEFKITLSVAEQPITIATGTEKTAVTVTAETVIVTEKQFLEGYLPYVAGGGVIALMVVLGVVLMMRRKRPAAPQVPPPAAPQVPPPAAPQVPPPAAPQVPPPAPAAPATQPARKFCVNCGLSIPQRSKFCPVCGSTQP